MVTDVQIPSILLIYKPLDLITVVFFHKGSVTHTKMSIFKVKIIIVNAELMWSVKKSR